MYAVQVNLAWIPMNLCIHVMILYNCVLYLYELCTAIYSVGTLSYVSLAVCHYATCMQGQSWSIGMDEGAQTVANFLKFYNPSVTGGSLGQHLSEVSAMHE